MTLLQPASSNILQLPKAHCLQRLINRRDLMSVIELHGFVAWEHGLGVVRSVQSGSRQHERMHKLSRQALKFVVGRHARERRTGAKSAM